MRFLISGPLLVHVLHFFVAIECGSRTGRLYLSDHQKDVLCSLNTSGMNVSFCRNINADKYYVKPDYTVLMENTCNALAKAVGFYQGVCMQSKNRFFGYTIGVTDACAITNSTADISSLDLNQGTQWIFLMFGPDAGDETKCECPNGLKDFDATT